MIKPVGERVLIKRLVKKSVGIELSNVHSKELTEGEVVATGDTNNFNIGDIVIVSKFQGEEYEEDYKIVDVKHILAIK